MIWLCYKCFYTFLEKKIWKVHYIYKLGLKLVCLFFIRFTHWGKNPHFTPISNVQNHIFQKSQFFKIVFLAKFTFLKSHFRNSFFSKIAFSKSHFWQKSHFQMILLNKNRVFKISFFTKIAISKLYYTKITF